MNRNTFATRKRRMNYANKVISEARKTEGEEFQNSSAEYLNKRKDDLVQRILNYKSEKEVKENQATD